MATPEDDAAVQAFTRDWWERLPHVYRAQDRLQSPVVPLLRWMDGPGRLAGTVRDLNTAMYDGTLMDPETTPGAQLPWLAFLLGIGESERKKPSDELRSIIRAQVTGREHGVATREHIAETARKYLADGADVQVVAVETQAWTLIIGVAPDDVPDGDYERVRDKVRAAGVIPAGHAVRVQDIRTTWDAWEATAGETWDDKEANVVTWQESNQAGVELT